MSDVKKGILDEKDFLLHEYDALREEIVQRTTARFSIIALSITAFGAIFALSSTSTGVYLQILYPILSSFLMSSYIANSYGSRKISAFIKIRIESAVDTGGEERWHHHKSGARIPFLKVSLSELLSNLLFPTSSFIAWVVAWITISAQGFPVLMREGIDLTHLALWFSLGIILVASFFAVFQGRIFNAEKDLEG